MNVYAKKNNQSIDEVLSHVFEGLSKPTELQKFRNIAKDYLAKKGDEPIDEKKFPNLAFLQQLNGQVLDMLGMTNLEEEITGQARASLFMPNL